MEYAKILSAELNVPEQYAAAAIALIDEGNTIPFIARYRKEQTGSLDDQLLREIYERLQYLRNLDTRKAEVRELIEGTGNLTPEIEKSLTNAATLAEIDDIYRPFRPKRKTRAGMAKERGLEPLAKKILAQEKGVDPMRLAEGYVNAEKGVNTSEDALNGAKDIIAVDQFGTLYKGCNSAEAHKNWLGEVTNPRQIKGGLKEAIEGADVFIGVSAPGMVTKEMVQTMNKDAIIFACANPTPEIFPDEAKAGGARVVSTGRSDYPNQINNVLAFPGIFRGAFDVRASDINEEMKIAASNALANLISDKELNENYIIPAAFDPRVGPAVAKAVAEAARKSGVARI